MLLVPTYVKSSPIHGIGVFAAAPIPAGAKMWAFQDGLDQLVPDALYAQLPEVARAFVDRYAFRSPIWTGGLVLGFDHARFINHSASPNTENSTEFAFALRDIAKDEEITCDYGEFCADFDIGEFARSA